MQRIMPRLGSVVKVTTRHQNINYFTAKQRPFDEFVHQGVVVQGFGDEGPETFTLLDQHPIYNKHVIALSNVVKLEFIKGSGFDVRGPAAQEVSATVLGSFDKKLGKQKEYRVTRKGDVWRCFCVTTNQVCEGFQFRKKCGHLEKSGL